MPTLASRIFMAPCLAVALTMTACMSQPDYRSAERAPETVTRVDLDKYAGKWFEIARYPNSFEKNCTNVTAEYSQRSDGKITVINTCFKGSAAGEKEVAEGVARTVEGSNNAKLKVKFAPEWVPFASGDYWILHLEDDYSAALVGDPEGKYLWILARTKTIDDVLLDKIKSKAATLGYETAPLEMTPQG